GAEHSHEQQTYHTGSDPEGRPIAVSFLSPTLMVAGPEEGVKLCLTRVASPAPAAAEAPLSEALGIYRNRPLVLGGVAVSRLPRLATLGPGAEALATLKSATLAMDADAVATIRVWAMTDSEEQADKVTTTARALLAVAKFLPSPKGGDEGKAVGLL